MEAAGTERIHSEWDKMAGEAQHATAAIAADNGYLPEIAAQAWMALRGANDPARLFVFGGALARLEVDEDAQPVIRSLAENTLRYELARAAVFERRDKRSGDARRVPPPMELVRDLLAAPDPPLPLLRRVVRAPVFAATGALVAVPGYHPEAFTYYAPAPGLVVPPVSPQPSDAEIQQARDLLLVELLGDFPFVGEADRAHTLALLLLPFVRDLIAGATPLHLISKPSPGTGATKLVDVVLGVSLGHALPIMTESHDEDDWRKKITAKLMTAPTAILIDNLRARLDSAAVSAAITGTVHEDRLLGRSEILRLPVRCAWIATGNNPAISNEIARRTVHVRLDAKVDRPWLRDGFRHPNLLAWAAEHRGDLIWAALTMGQAWIAAGRPKSPVRLGMFESWGEVVGGVLEVCGVPGLLGNAADLYTTADAEGAAWRALVERWWGKHADAHVGVSDLWTLLNDATADPIALPLGNGGERSQRTRFGLLIARQRDRRFGDLQVLAGEKRQGAQLWTLKRWPS